MSLCLSMLDVSPKEVAALGDIVTSMESGFACGKSRLVEHGLLHLRPFNVGIDGHLDLSEMYRIPIGIAPATKSSLQAGDLLFNNTNSRDLVGKIALIHKNMEAGFSNHMTRIRLDSSRCEPLFLVFYMRQLWLDGYFRDRCTQWVSQAAFGSKLLADVRIPLPPLAEQRRIAGILNRAAHIQRLRARATDHLRSLAPALFAQTFGDPAANPMGWPIARLGELCETDRQILQPDNPQAAGLPFVGVENVGSGTGVLGFDTRSRVGSQKSAAFRFDKQHILYARLRPYLNKVATPSFEGRCSTELVPLLPRNNVDRHFLAHLLRHKTSVDFATASVTGARMPRTDMKVLMSMPVPLPPLAEQRRFATVAGQAQRMTRTAETATATARALAASLMARLLNPNPPS